MIPGKALVDLASALFIEWHGEPPRDIRPVAADGSTRSYWRLTAGDGASAIGAHGPDPMENRAFLSYSRTLRELGLPVPEVYGADEKSGVWLLEDLGDTTLFDAIKEARDPGSDAFPDAVLPLYRQVLEILPRFQVEGGRRIDFRRAYPRAAFDRQSILW
ncbi:MAG: phosphotransferase enzyme family protein, partial [Gemmatimonadetes bacterium]|nr:phosphotransferase enzyme family protein [Candidatus Palauibacter australiensis]